MTVYLRDMSHFDGNESLAGFVGATHKVTEGSSFVDPEFARRLNSWRGAGVKVLGSYHVLHTGNLAGQLDHWLSTLDALAPWWRSFPHWLMQVDAERWPADNVSADTVKSFARLLVGSGAPGWKVTYASRGQYGDGLTGIATPLWHAAYHSQTYPGDGAADWAPYSGQAPVLWQYTSTPYDKNAYRGSLDELLTLTGGDDMTREEHDALMKLVSWFDSFVNKKGTPPYPVVQDIAATRTALGNVTLSSLLARFDAQDQALSALSAKLDALTPPPLAGDLSVTGTLHVAS